MRRDADAGERGTGASLQNRGHPLHTRCVGRGAALLEVIAGLVILGVAGVGFVMLLGQQAHAIRELRDREATIREAAGLLARIDAWSHRELADRVGVRTNSRVRVEIALLAPSLYTISVFDGGTSTVVLRTSRYAPTVDDDAY